VLSIISPGIELADQPSILPVSFANNERAGTDTKVSRSFVLKKICLTYISKTIYKHN
jgi:hypothetical protein